MKKTYRALALLLITALMLPLYGQAAEKHYNIKELKEQARHGWTSTYEIDGRKVEVNIDIDVPDVETAPVLRIRQGNNSYTPQALQDELLYTVIHLPNDEDPKNYEGAFALFLNAPEGQFSLQGGNLTLTRPAEWKKADTLYRTWLRPWDFSKAYTQDNPYTLQQAVDAVLQRVEQATNGKLDFSLNMVDSIGVYRVASWKELLPELDGLISPEYYGLHFTQNLRGLPLLRAMDIEMMTSEPPKGTRAVFSQGEIRAKIASDSAYSIGVKAVEETELIREDIPLCSLDTIKQAIERLIRSGHLRSVNSLRLGLVAYADPKDPSDVIAVPSWVVMGNYYNDPKQADNWWNNFTPDGKAFIGGARNYLKDIVINAQTGKVLVNLTDPADQLAPEIMFCGRKGPAIIGGCDDEKV